MEYLRRKAKDFEKSLKERFGIARPVSPVESPISKTAFCLPGIVDIHSKRIKNTLIGLTQEEFPALLDRVNPNLEDATAIYTLRDLSKEEVVLLTKKAFANSHIGLMYFLRPSRPQKVDTEELERISQVCDYLQEECKNLDKSTKYAYEFGKSWFDKERQKLLATKQALYNEAAETDTVLELLFSSHKKDKWRSIKDRMLIATYLEHKECVKQYEEETAVDFIGGFTLPSDVPQMHVASIVVTGDLFLEERADEAVLTFQYDMQGAKKRLVHEAFHLAPTPKITTITYSLPPATAAEIGFTKYTFTGNTEYLDGIRIIKKENEGLTEGAIVFLSAFYQAGMDIVAAVNSLGKIDPRVSSVSESEYGYDAMGGLTGKIVRELGMTVFLEAYVNSDPSFWQKAIEQKMGKEFYEEYKTKGLELVDQAKYRIKEPDF